MYENFNDYEEVDLLRKKSSKKYIYIVITVVFVFIIMLYFFLNGNKDYSFYEEKMIKEAAEYVLDNHISTSKEIFIDVSKLGVEIPNNCALTSGVIYNGSTYKAYLACSDYESKIIENSNINIQLMGNEVEIILKGMDYVDLGYISKHNVLVNGEVKDEEGVYNIYYVLDNNEVVTRKVIVLNNSNLLKSFPTILLNGEEIVYIRKGEEYQEEGFIAYDSNGNDLSNSVIKTSLVDSNQLGEYKIVYQVKDSKSYTISTIRKVIVSSESDLDIISSLSTTNITNQSIKIIINVLGNNYSYTILPNGEEEKNKIFSYEVIENGTYNFKIVTDSDEIINKEVVVNNIYRTNPSGSCNVILNNDKAVISVNTSVEENILGYNYIVDDRESGYINQSSYTSYNTAPNSILVKVMDNVGNIGEISCNITDNRVKMDPNGIQRTLSGEPLHMSIRDALSRKGHTVNELNACIYNRVKEAGPGTRYGVVAAGVGLIECTKEMTGYIISYEHCSGKVEGGSCTSNSDICGKLGVNTKWGMSTSGGCCRNNGSCWTGLNCANYVRWSFCNGGMDLCTKGSAGASSLASLKYFPGADSFEIYGKSVRYKFGNNYSSYSASYLLQLIKPGDIIHTYRKDDPDGSSEHVLLVIGKDNNSFYFADNGSRMYKVSFSEVLSGDKVYQVLLLDNYYSNDANKNNLYN